MSEESLTENGESGREDDPMLEDEESVTGTYPQCAIHGGNGFDDIRDPPMEQLQEFLEDWSNRSVDRFREGSLLLSNVAITRPMIALLLPFMLPVVHEELSSSLSDHSPGTTRNNTPVKFCSIRIENSCRFFSHDDIRVRSDSDNVCTLNDKRSFLSALARATGYLMMDEDCPEIVSGLLNTPEIDHLEVRILSICQNSPLWDLEYVRLGAMIQRSVHLDELYLDLPFVEVPRAFLDSLANSIHIQRLSIRSPRRTMSNISQKEAILSNLIVGDDGNGVVERLLRNLRSQLAELELTFTDLEDSHLLAIAKLLPCSKVDSIDFSHNCITSKGLLEFARQLSKMPALIAVHFDSNPWENSPLELREECGAALLQGLIEIPSIQWMSTLDHHFPQAPLLLHYLYLNRAGRRILTPFQEQPIPDGLWPHVLARAGSVKGFERTIIPIPHEGNGNFMYNVPANAVYFFLRNSPKLFDSC